MTPDETVRVLVGRLETITPAVEDEVITPLRQVAADHAAQRRRGEARLARLGRFLDPHLRRVLQITKDPAVAAEARRRLQRENPGVPIR